MSELISFMIGCLVVEVITRYKIIELMNKLDKVCNTGEEMWQSGVKYAMNQIMKMF